MRIFRLLFISLVLFAACAEPAPEPGAPEIVAVQFGPFTFEITDDWKMTQHGDELILEKDSQRVTVTKGFNLLLTVFTPHPDPGRTTGRLAFLSAGEKELLTHFSPAVYYPDSLPSVGPLRFVVSIDSVFRKYICYSDTSLFSDELLAVHLPSGNCLHAEPGGRQADPLFSRIEKTVRFSPGLEPTLLSFTGDDTTMDCCYKERDDGTRNPFFAKNVLHLDGNILEYRISPRFNNTSVESLDGAMRLKGDSIFLSVKPGGGTLRFFPEIDEWLAAPPAVKTLQCSCYTCRTVLFRIYLPAPVSRYSFVFESETIASGDTLIP
jgi:hypothetical protein